MEFMGSNDIGMILYDMGLKMRTVYTPPHGHFTNMKMMMKICGWNEVPYFQTNLFGLILGWRISGCFWNKKGQPSQWSHKIL